MLTPCRVEMLVSKYFDGESILELSEGNLGKIRSYTRNGQVSRFSRKQPLTSTTSRHRSLT
jgi:hypothetical protein